MSEASFQKRPGGEHGHDIGYLSRGAGRRHAGRRRRAGPAPCAGGRGRPGGHQLSGLVLRRRPGQHGARHDRPAAGLRLRRRRQRARLRRRGRQRADRRRPPDQQERRPRLDPATGAGQPGRAHRRHPRRRGGHRHARQDGRGQRRAQDRLVGHRPDPHRRQPCGQRRAPHPDPAAGDDAARRPPRAGGLADGERLYRRQRRRRPARATCPRRRAAHTRLPRQHRGQRPADHRHGGL